MDKFFTKGDRLLNLHKNLKKSKTYTKTTRNNKVKLIKEILTELKEVVITSKNYEQRIQYLSRYRHLKKIARECIQILKSPQLERTTLEGNIETEEEQNNEDVNDENEDEENGKDEELEEDKSDSSIDPESEEEEMPPKLDLGLALKVVHPFDGAVTKLTAYIESVELLQDYAEGVPEADILKFMRTTLKGAAHGAIENCDTITLAKEALKQKFAIRVTPRAVENELNAKRQQNKSISDFGSEIEQLSAKLAAAHVSTGTFANEAAAVNIVEPIAVQAFANGLRDPATKFFLRARNPTTLNKAISDALECQTNPNAESKMDSMIALWCGHGGQNDKQNYKGHNNTWRGRGSERGRGFFRGNRGNYRDRGNYQQYNENRGNYRGRGNYHQHSENRPAQNNNVNTYNNRRGRYNPHQANMAERVSEEPRQQTSQQQQQPRQEEANLIDLFR